MESNTNHNSTIEITVLLSFGLNLLPPIQVVEALKIAGNDSRVKGLKTMIGANQQFDGLAQIQELRNAVIDFR